VWYKVSGRKVQNLLNGTEGPLKRAAFVIATWSKADEAIP
jgi:hypothetical protein